MLSGSGEGQEASQVSNSIYPTPPPKRGSSTALEPGHRSRQETRGAAAAATLRLASSQGRGWSGSTGLSRASFSAAGGEKQRARKCSRVGGRDNAPSCHPFGAASQGALKGPELPPRARSCRARRAEMGADRRRGTGEEENRKVLL